MSQDSPKQNVAFKITHQTKLGMNMFSAAPAVIVASIAKLMSLYPNGTFNPELFRCGYLARERQFVITLPKMLRETYL